MATRIGLTPDDFDCLLNGNVTHPVASALGVSVMDVTGFIKGRASAAMMSRLGLQNLDSAGELAELLGPQGAKGLLIGLLMS